MIFAGLRRFFALRRFVALRGVCLSSPWRSVIHRRALQRKPSMPPESQESSSACSRQEYRFEGEIQGGSSVVMEEKGLEGLQGVDGLEGLESATDESISYACCNLVTTSALTSYISTAIPVYESPVSTVSFDVLIATMTAHMDVVDLGSLLDRCSKASEYIARHLNVSPLDMLGRYHNVLCALEFQVIWSVLFLDFRKKPS
ncbi:hypothetical protein BJX99DRAFT_237871 [Aspergillus californicus]